MKAAAPIDPAALSQLAEIFSGQLLLPGDDGYEEARRVHNGMIDKHPAVVARCVGVVDVVEALGFAIENDLEIAVRGGGHNVAGRAVCNAGMMLDLSPMKGVHVDAASRSARAQPGVTWGEFNRETQLYELASTGGLISSTGVAGLTLGGGFGYLMGKHGLTIDNLKSAELVTARGEVLRVSDDENPDLFWGIRGGGGNFGVVTSFEFELHSIGPYVDGGMIAYPAQKATDMLRFFRDFTSDLPDALSMLASLTHAPDGSGTQLAAMLACHCGGQAESRLPIESIKAHGASVIDQLGPIAYTTINTILDNAFPKLALNYWKSSFIAALTDEVIQILIEQFRACPSPMSKLILEHFHGKAVEPKPVETAFPHRQAGYNVLIISQWRDPHDSERNIAWAKATYAALEPYMRSGVYSNYMSDDEPAARVQMAFGENFQRLRELKLRYDPENRFHLNQNIPPSPSP